MPRLLLPSLFRPHRPLSTSHNIYNNGNKRQTTTTTLDPRRRPHPQCLRQHQTTDNRRLYCRQHIFTELRAFLHQQQHPLFTSTMAATRAKKQQPVGSTGWIVAEKENVAQLVDQEMEEIEYPVRHEMEWLNEHMAEIFSTNQLYWQPFPPRYRPRGKVLTCNESNVTEIFKTPGKLRGKTPRTARKRNVLEPRVVSVILAIPRLLFADIDHH